MSGTDYVALLQSVFSGDQLQHTSFTAPEQAAANLRLLAPHFPSTTGLARVLADLADSAAPDMALNNLERFLAASARADNIAEYIADRDDVRTALVTLFAGSQFLSDVLIAQPHAFHWLIEENGLWYGRGATYYREAARSHIEGHVELSDQRRVLSMWRRREMLRIGMRDLLGLATMEEVTRDISDLAQAIIQLGAELTYQAMAQRYGHPVPESASWDSGSGDSPAEDISPASTAAGMCVLGMGKLGGRELNFSSDIDLVFIYEAEGQTTGRLDGTRRVAVVTNHVFFSRMGEALVKFLAERRPEGNLFRVDMRLRPEGQDGPLVRSLESFITYLSSQARDWERIAYLKARVMSGPSHLTERLYRVISRFVYAGVEPGQIIREIQELKLRIDREVTTSDLYEREVKRGYGGIREIEFVIAAMQIIHGYAHHALRVRNVFLAVQRLQEVHILSDEEAVFYLHAYSFLRLIEHRLQMAEEHQTHTVPTDLQQLQQLARRCGFKTAGEFQSEYRRTTHEVHSRFLLFFEEDVAAIDEEKRDLLLITDRDAPQVDVAAALARRGVLQPGAVQLIHALTFGTREVFISPEGQRSFEQMLPSLLRLISSAPIPERVLPNLHSFAMAMKSITYYYEVMAQHPEILRLLVMLFGTSSFYSQALISHPEYFDALISSRVLEQEDTANEAKRQRIANVLSSKLPQRRLIMLRRAVIFENLLTALRYVLKLRTLPDCLRELSDTADMAVDTGMRITCERLAAAASITPQAFMDQVRQHFAIIALGKYGGAELNFFGDLDVVFVYRDNAEADAFAQSVQSGAAESFVNIADVLNNVLSEQLQDGRAFVLDARLRPHGRNAPHATPLSQYIAYLHKEAEVWELQALSRARCVWGECSILAELAHAASTRTAAMSAQTIREEITSMRTRLEAAAAGEDASVELKFKRAAGGLVDVEFLLQWIALSGSAPVPANYFAALQSPAVKAALGIRADELTSMYAWLRELETAVRLVTNAGTSTLPGDATELRAVSQLMGFSEPTALSNNLREVMSGVRAIYNDVIGTGHT
jgi:glutamate-ammonia-ligase adenylyltransferase